MMDALQTDVLKTQPDAENAEAIQAMLAHVREFRLAHPELFVSVGALVVEDAKKLMTVVQNA